MAGVKTKTARRIANPIETATGPDREFAHIKLPQKKDSVTGEITKQISGTGNDFITQLLGWDNPDYELPAHNTDRLSGDLEMGVAIKLKSPQQDQKRLPRKELYIQKFERRLDILGGYDYRTEVIHGSERLSRREASALESKIGEIMAELKRMIGSSTILKSEFAEISLENKPQHATKYYLNFFEWLLIELKKIRMKVEDAGAWLAVMKSKKAQRKYGKMAKKFGTSFTLSNERTTATQTG